MKTFLLADPVRYRRMTTEELRESFLFGGLYEAGALHLNYVDLDRAVVGMAAPVEKPLALPNPAELRADCFTERRELGVLNIGGAGVVRVGGSAYQLGNLDLLYIGRGNADVEFASASKEAPAVFYLLSYPAHASYPVTLVRKDEAQPIGCGSGRELQSANDLQVHPRRRRKELPACDGRHASARGQCLEHHASAHAHAPVRDLPVL